MICVRLAVGVQHFVDLRFVVGVQFDIAVLVTLVQIITKPHDSLVSLKNTSSTK